MTAAPSPSTKRFVEQRWALDGVIAANGIDWDQPRSLYWNAPCGLGASYDFETIRERVEKLADISIEFAAQAERRERLARRAVADGSDVAAREHFFIAAIHWGAAQWSIDVDDAENRRYNERKRACFGEYALRAAHRVEDVEIPFLAGRLRAWLHLPVGYSGGRVPFVVSYPGMDSFKEASVAMYGDPLLSRGIAVLAVDGPGQYEAPLDGIFLTVDNWLATGRACVEYLLARNDVDPAKIAAMGRSFGSFAATIAASAEPRFCAVSVSATCFAPGFEPVCQSASPTFKMRLMFMSNFTDERRFDEFRQSLHWEGRVDGLTAPYLCIAGQLDELSPVENAERLMRTLRGPRRLVIYEKSRHSVGSGVSSALLGPNVNTLEADWLRDVFAGKPFATERWFVDVKGDVHVSALDAEFAS